MIRQVSTGLKQDQKDEKPQEASHECIAGPDTLRAECAGEARVVARQRQAGSHRLAVPSESIGRIRESAALKRPFHVMLHDVSSQDVAVVAVVDLGDHVTLHGMIRGHS